MSLAASLELTTGRCAKPGKRKKKRRHNEQCVWRLQWHRNHSTHIQQAGEEGTILSDHFQLWSVDHSTTKKKAAHHSVDQQKQATNTRGGVCHITAVVFIVLALFFVESSTAVHTSRYSFMLYRKRRWRRRRRCRRRWRGGGGVRTSQLTRKPLYRILCCVYFVSWQSGG